MSSEFSRSEEYSPQTPDYVYKPIELIDRIGLGEDEEAYHEILLGHICDKLDEITVRLNQHIFSSEGH